MWWMIGFWFFYICAFIIFIINKKYYKSKELKYISGLFLVYSFFSFIIAVITKDPLFEAIGLPAGYEWIGGVGLIGFASWHYYLNPLKERVIDCEKNIEVINTNIKGVNKTLEEFRPHIIKYKK